MAASSVLSTPVKTIGGTITLASDLTERETEFQDFVIVHELLHFRVPNHGKLFKALMTAHLPNWREHDMAK